MNIIIEQGRVICPVQGLDQVTDVYISKGKILSLGEPQEAFAPDTIIKAKDCLVIPGLVDTYGYLKDENGEVYEDIVKSAPKYGFTTLFCSPKGHYITDKPARAQKVSQTEHPVDIFPIGALTEALEGKQIADLTALRKAGCRVFSQDLKPIRDLSTVRNCYLYAATFDMKIVIHPMEPSLATGCIHEGVVSAMLGLKGIPYSAETIAVAQHLHLIEETGVRAHFTHITCSASLDLISQAQKQGLPITADCTMHHLHLSEMDVMDLNPNMHVYPPLRSTRDLLSLRKGLEEGVLTAICSSHQPLPKLLKQAPFAETSPGLSSLAIMLSLGLHLVQQGHLSLMTWVKAVTTGPLQAYDLAAPSLQAGSQADLCVIDPEPFWSVTESTFEAQSRNSPFIGWELPGKVKSTIKEGTVAYSA